MVESSGDVLHMAKVVGAPAEIVELIAARVERRDPDVVAYEEEEAAASSSASASALEEVRRADVAGYVAHWRKKLLSSAWWDGDTFASAEQARWLLERGLDPRLRNWLGITALHRCAAKGLIDIAAVLLEFGASIDAVDAEWAQTPKGWAVRKGQPAMADWLAARGGV
jgi:hypothetical protein